MVAMDLVDCVTRRAEVDISLGAKNQEIRAKMTCPKVTLGAETGFSPESGSVTLQPEDRLPAPKWPSDGHVRQDRPVFRRQWNYRSGPAV